MGWKPTAQPLRHTRSHLARFTSHEETTRTLATVAEVESAARGFGDRSSATASRPNWGDRRDSNSLAADSQSARAPYCVRPPCTPWSHRPDSNGHHRATRAVVCRLTYSGSLNWSHRRESNALLPHYQCGVQPAELRRLTHWRGRRGSNPHGTCLRNRGAATRAPSAHTSGGANRI